MALRVSACVATGGWLANLGWLDILCYITAFLVPVLAVPGMFTAWKNKALGQRGRRPDPVIAALLCNCAWFEFGWTEKSDEAMCINLYGGVFQAMYLATFFVLCSGGERVGAIKRVLPAALFLSVTTLPVGVELHKVLCTVCGMAAAATPLLSFVLTENRSVDMLPH